MIDLFFNKEKIPVTWHEFSDGALTCKINLPECFTPPTELYVDLHVSPLTPCKQVVEELCLISDAIYNWMVTHTDATTHMSLYLPYLPYGRADRMFEPGNPEPLSLFMAQLQSFVSAWGCVERVYVCDPHNPYFLDSVDFINFDIKNQKECLLDALRGEMKPTAFGGLGLADYRSTLDYILAPDKGAVAKATDIASHFGLPLICAEKVRDISTGQIISTTFDAVLPRGSKVLICDDILDAGGTFIPLARTLKDLDCRVELYVTHLIAARGLGLFGGLIDKIRYYQIVGSYINPAHVENFNLISEKRTKEI